MISPEMRNLVDACDRHKLTGWETKFLNSVRSRRRPLTDKQLTILRKIAAGRPNWPCRNLHAKSADLEIVWFQWFAVGAA